MKESKRKKYEKLWQKQNDFLKSQGLPPESFDVFVKKQTGKYRPRLRGVKVETRAHRKSPNVPSADSYAAAKLARKKEMKYTGDKLMGIATMHKSNMVPVFKQEDAEDIAKMRRN